MCAKGKCTYLIIIVCRLSVFTVSAFIFSTLTLNISQPLHCHSIISSVLLAALVNSTFLEPFAFASDELFCHAIMAHWQRRITLGFRTS